MAWLDLQCDIQAVKWFTLINGKPEKVAKFLKFHRTPGMFYQFINEKTKIVGAHCDTNQEYQVTLIRTVA
jgi:mannosyltransferase OCH1-like enzyme